MQKVGDKITVSGQVAVMGISALLAKITFDKNPGHEFFVDESFPLEWMIDQILQTQRRAEKAAPSK